MKDKHRFIHLEIEGDYSAQRRPATKEYIEPN
jgi:hypothetical protein